MFKPLIFLLALSLSGLLPGLAVPVAPETTCISNCYSCPEGPTRCANVQSLPFPGQNYNCLPYASGTGCEGVGFGYQRVQQAGLEGWQGGTVGNCAMLGAGGTGFGVVGLLAPTALITKNITINRDTIEKVVVSVALTLRSSSPFNPNSTLASLTLSSSSLNLTLQLLYPSQSALTNTSCGLYLQYLHALQLNQSIPSIDNNTYRLEVRGFGAADDAWGLAKLQLLVGCGGLTIPGADSKCGACRSGYYEIRGRDGVLLGCGVCDRGCRACTRDKCTLCMPTTELNETTGRCQLKRTYVEAGEYRMLAGRAITSNSTEGGSDYFPNLITTETTTASITLQSELLSPAPFVLRFFLLYSTDFLQSISSSPRPVTISQGQTTLLSIPAAEFRPEVGYYDPRILSGTRRVFVREVYIDRLDVENLLTNVEVTIRSPVPQPLHVADYIVTQYQCSLGCAQCDRLTDVCLQCKGFFLNGPDLPCVACPNGFYKGTRSAPASNASITPTSGDQICIKCHSSCLQCMGSMFSQCTSCFTLFQLGSVSYNKNCIRCLHEETRQGQSSTRSGECSQCLSEHPITTVLSDANCSQCLRNRSLEQTTQGQACRSCWLAQKLAYGRCVPRASSGLTFYGSDVTNGVISTGSWSSSSPLVRSVCSDNYQSIWGINNTNNSANASLQWSQSTLPPHTGLYIIFNIIKTDIQSTLLANGTRRSQSLYITIDNGNAYTVELLSRRNGSAVVPGANICGRDTASEMIHTFTYDAPRHTGRVFNFTVSSENGGIFVREMEVYLGNCDACASGRLNYEVKYIPRYTYNNTVSSGLDVFLEFNQPVKAASGSDLSRGFGFDIDKLPNSSLVPQQFQDSLQLNNRLKYYLPLDSSFTNGTMTIETAQDTRIFSSDSAGVVASVRRLLLSSPLNILSSDQLIIRFSKLSVDDLVSTTQIYWFFNICQWFALITMIVCVLLGIDVVFEEFSIALQLLFIHGYLSTALLPATFKAPLLGLQRMENLNYFADANAQQVESLWIGDYVHPSPVQFLQYNKDILFIRSIYPIIIINLVYLGWFLLLFLVYKCVPRFQTSTNTLVGFIRSIPARPLNYFDQIWRYQFIAVIWAAFMQFHVLKNDTPWERFNLALCFITFIVAVVWPLFVVLYTYHKNSYRYFNGFAYDYQDIFFLRSKAGSEKSIKYYNYILIRFGRYLVIALFISVFTEFEIIGPIILICANLIEIAYVVALKIYYNSSVGVVLKVAENIFFIAIEVALLIVYALSDTAAEKDFLNLGFALVVLYVVVVLLAFGRVVYYLYEKWDKLDANMKLGRGDGEVIVVGATPLPNTDRNEDGAGVV